MTQRVRRQSSLLYFFFLKKKKLLQNEGKRGPWLPTCISGGKTSPLSAQYICIFFLRCRSWEGILFWGRKHAAYVFREDCRPQLIAVYSLSNKNKLKAEKVFVNGIKKGRLNAQSFSYYTVVE